MEKLTKQKLLHNLCGFTLTITKLKIFSGPNQFKDNYFIYLFISFLLRDLKKKMLF